MKKALVMGMGMLVLSMAMAQAEGNAPAATKAPEAKKEAAPVVKPELKDLTLVGTVEKKGSPKGDMYFLVMEDGTRARLPKGNDAPDFAALVGAKVKVVGKGFELEKNGRKRIGLKSVTSTEKVADAPAAPAAPATPAAK